VLQDNKKEIKNLLKFRPQISNIISTAFSRTKQVTWPVQIQEDREIDITFRRELQKRDVYLGWEEFVPIIIKES
jgi:hypothetical protein